MTDPRRAHRLSGSLMRSSAGTLVFERVVFTRDETRLDADYQVTATSQGALGLASREVIAGFFTNLVGQPDPATLATFEARQPPAAFLVAPLDGVRAPGVLAFGCVRISPTPDRHGRRGILHIHALLADDATWDRLEGDPFRLLDLEAEGALDGVTVFPPIAGAGDELEPLTVPFARGTHTPVDPGQANVAATLWPPPHPPSELGDATALALEVVGQARSQSSIVFTIEPNPASGLEQLARACLLALPRSARAQFPVLTLAFDPVVAASRFAFIGALPHTARLAARARADWRALTPVVSSDGQARLQAYVAPRALAADAGANRSVGSVGGAARRSGLRDWLREKWWLFAAGGALLLFVLLLLLGGLGGDRSGRGITRDDKANGSRGVADNDDEHGDNNANANAGNVDGSNGAGGNNAAGSSDENPYAALVSPARFAEAWEEDGFHNDPLTPGSRGRERFGHFADALLAMVARDWLDRPAGTWPPPLAALALHVSLRRWRLDGRDDSELDLEVRLELTLSHLDQIGPVEIAVSLLPGAGGGATTTEPVLVATERFEARDRFVQTSLRASPRLRFEPPIALYAEGTITRRRPRGPRDGERVEFACRQSAALAPASLWRLVDSPTGLTLRVPLEDDGQAGAEEIGRLEFRSIRVFGPADSDAALYCFPDTFVQLGPVISPD